MAGHLLAVHVVPRDDLIEHQADDSCPCGPTDTPVELAEGGIGWMAVHHSLDHREAAEQ